MCLRPTPAELGPASDRTMNAMNPYSCTRPGNLFVGYADLRERLLEGFCDGDSFATLSGRRCGKTSLLLQLEKDLQAQDLSLFVPLPRFLDMQAFGTLTPASLFEALYVCVTQDVAAPAWSLRQTANVYQDFLQHLDAAKPLLDQQHGSNWLIILLIDELDAAVSPLKDDQFFQNLRNLLTVSRFQHHFRLVATGVNDLAELISSGSSPLNNLNNQYLRILTNEEAGELIHKGFPQGLPAELEQSLLERTGGHPYLLQGLLARTYA